MSPDTPITIVMTTYFEEGERGEQRFEAAYKTLVSWRNFLAYKGTIHLHLADDGFPNKQFGLFFIEAAKIWRDRDHKVTFSRQARQGVGASLNTGFRYGFTVSPVVLYAVDDWSLIDPFDITSWVQLLVEREDVGMVRLGPPHPGLTGRIQAFTRDHQSWGLCLDRQGFAYGQRPALYHQRFYEAYGAFGERMTALRCEQEYMGRIAVTPGPDIVLALPHPWRHIDTISLSALEPDD